MPHHYIDADDAIVTLASALIMTTSLIEQSVLSRHVALQRLMAKKD